MRITYMTTEFSKKLKALMQQFGITNVQLSKALNVDHSLVSRWLNDGCSKRKLSQHALSVDKYIAGRRMTPYNKAWLRAKCGCADDEEISPLHIALWLAPDLDIPYDSELHLMLAHKK